MTPGMPDTPYLYVSENRRCSAKEYLEGRGSATTPQVQRHSFFIGLKVGENHQFNQYNTEMLFLRRKHEIPEVLSVASWSCRTHSWSLCIYISSSGGRGSLSSSSALYIYPTDKGPQRRDTRSGGPAGGGGGDTRVRAGDRGAATGRGYVLTGICWSRICSWQPFASLRQ